MNQKSSVTKSPQSTYIDTYAKVAQAKLYKTKTPITGSTSLRIDR